MSDQNNFNHPLERPVMFHEYLPHKPYQLLHEVFTHGSSAEDLKAFIIHWGLKIDFYNPSITPGDKFRTALHQYYSSLIHLIDALNYLESERGLINSLGLTTVEQVEYKESTGNPLIVIQQFCRRYSVVYTRRELWCFLNAIVDYAAGIPGMYDSSLILDAYERILALTETAYVLSAEGKL